MAGFQRDVTQNIQVPNSAGTNSFSNSANNLSALADVASIGLQVYGNVQQQKKAEAVAVKNEGLAKEALSLNSMKLQMQSQGLSAEKQNAAIEKKLSMWSAVDQIALRGMAAEDSLGSGNSVKSAAEEETAERIAAEKFKVDTNNTAAQEMGYTGFSDLTTDEQGNTPEDQISIHMAEEADLKAQAARLEVSMKNFQFGAANEVATQRGVKKIVDFSMNKINLDVRKGIRVGTTNLRKKLASNEITTEEFGKAYVDMLRQGTIRTQEFYAASISQMPPEVQTEMEGRLQGLMTNYEAWADTMQDTGDGVRTVKNINANIALMDANATAQVYETEGIAGLVAQVKLKLVDTALLNTLGLANKSAGDNVKIIGEALSNSLKTGNSGESSYAGFYADADTSDLDTAAVVVNQVNQDTLDGKIADTSAAQEFVTSTTISYMNDVINKPALNQFRGKPLKTYTDTILHKNYETLPEAERKTISDNAPAFARRFFGTNNSGAFVPSVNQMLENVGLKDVLSPKQGPALWSLGVNKDTGMLEVSMAGTERIIENITKTSPRATRTLSPQAIRDVEKNLRTFKQNLENNKDIKKVLQATAKATGSDLADVSHVVLSDLSRFSNIPVAEAFTRRPAEEGEEAPTVAPSPTAPNDFDDLDDEQFEEVINQMRGSRAGGNTDEQLIDDDGDVWIRQPDGSLQRAPR
tara:strand:+ start:265 stop:2349 length:2085 start_codon:yes stop_codon:yes gene_type:complete